MKTPSATEYFKMAETYFALCNKFEDRDFEADNCELGCEIVSQHARLMELFAIDSEAFGSFDLPYDLR